LVNLNAHLLGAGSLASCHVQIAAGHVIGRGRLILPLILLWILAVVLPGLILSGILTGLILAGLVRLGLILRIVLAGLILARLSRLGLILSAVLAGLILRRVLLGLG
jgi:hypothetical protein